MKPTVIDPKTTSRAEAYALWMNAPNPMVTFFKTLDVTPLYRLSRRRGLKFNKYNTYIRDFFADNPGKKLHDAIVCWNYRKSLPGCCRYEKSDVIALDRPIP